MFGCGAAAANGLLAAAPARTLIARAQPLIVVTAWGPFGVRCFWTLAATLAAAALSLILALILTAHDARRPNAIGAEVALAAGAALAAAWAWPFVFSSDVYAYAAYGAMALRGLDPYALAAPSLHGALVDAARWQWGGTYPVCVYGPAFVGLSEVAVWATRGASLAATLWMLRAIEALAFVGSIFAVDALLRERPARLRFIAVAAYGLNPVALWTVAEGHNDALLLGVAGAGLLAARHAGRRWTSVGAGLVGFAAALKATGTVYAAAVATEALAFSVGAARRRLITGAALGLALAAAVSAPPLAVAFGAITSGGRYAPAASLQTFVGIVPAYLLAAGAVGYGAWRLRAGDREGYSWCALSLWCAVPNVYPWYALWVLPAVASGGGIVTASVWFATIFSALRYLPDAAGASSASTMRLAAGVAFLPLAGAVAALFSHHLKKASNRS